MQPIAVPSLPDTVAGGEEPTKLRVGRVVAITAGRVSVAVGGVTVTGDAAYLASYTPVLGDWVHIIWQGASLLILGALAGAPADNVCPNWSFENTIAAVGAPGSWGIWTVTGTATTEVVTVPDGQELHGTQAAKITVTSAGGTTRIYSNQIQVQPGQVWSAAAQTSPAGAGADTVTVGAYLAWQAAAGDTPPTYVQLDTVASHDFVGRSPAWYQLRPGGATAGKAVPATANYLRVVLSVATGAANSAALFDRVLLRQIN